MQVSPGSVFVFIFAGWIGFYVSCLRVFLVLYFLCASLCVLLVAYGHVCVCFFASSGVCEFQYLRDCVFRASICMYSCFANLTDCCSANPHECVYRCAHFDAFLCVCVSVISCLHGIAFACKRVLRV